MGGYWKPQSQLFVLHVPLPPTCLFAMLEKCFVKGFEWDRMPAGRVGKLGDNEAYITGSYENVAIMVTHDVFGGLSRVRGCSQINTLEKGGATVYMPDL
jgi:hypothetical protein